MLERFYWRFGMNICTRWWLCNRLKCQVRKASRLTVRWPIISMPLSQGPSSATSVDYFSPLPVTPQGNTYILCFTDRFSRLADMFTITTAEFTAEGTSKILTNRYIPVRGCLRSTLLDNGLQFCSKFSRTVYKFLGVRKVATSSNHQNGNGRAVLVN